MTRKSFQISEFNVLTVMSSFPLFSISISEDIVHSQKVSGTFLIDCNENKNKI